MTILLFKTRVKQRDSHLLRPDLLKDLVHLPRLDGFAGDVYGVDAVAEDRKVELLADAVFHMEAVHRLCFLFWLIWCVGYVVDMLDTGGDGEETRRRRGGDEEETRRRGMCMVRYYCNKTWNTVLRTRVPKMPPHLSLPT